MPKQPKPNGTHGKKPPTPSLKVRRTVRLRNKDQAASR